MARHAVRPDRDPPADRASTEAWAASGAMSLTGRPGAPPLGPPAGLVPGLVRIADRLRTGAAALGGELVVDPLALLGERAAVAGFRRGGTTSCGGATRLLPAADGWIAVSLARSDDVELVPAWLDGAEPGDDVWGVVGRAVARSATEALLERGRLLGLPIAALPPGPSPAGVVGDPVLTSPLPGRSAPIRSLDGVLVVDLSSLWAGPLCGGLLAEAGADVVKVESTARPDGGRSGPPAFFDILNGDKRSVALDLRAARGVATLRRLVARADVVVEASRPRALGHLGLDPVGLGVEGPKVWVSITGHGRAGPAGGWVAFGDDAAVAGGLVSRDGAGPCFCADAVADPTSGLAATAATLAALAADGRTIVDVAMSTVAAHLAGPTLPVPGDPSVAPPRARPVRRRAPELGAHTAEVLTELGIGP